MHSLAFLLSLMATLQADDWSRAVVRIGGCSGVCVSADGLVLTARHCQLSDRERVHFHNGPSVPATRLLISRNGDGPVAFVCDGDGFPYLPVSDTKPEAGDAVVSYGFPARNARRQFERGEGVVQSGGRYRLEGVPFHGNSTTIRCAGGWSGGPLLNSRGQVIGLCSNGDATTTAFTSFASTRHAYEQAMPLARELVLSYSRAEVVVFVTKNCGPCERLKADIAAGHFAKWTITQVAFDPDVQAWTDVALKDEFLQVARPQERLSFPVVWVRGSTEYRVGYDPAQRGGLIGFIERVIDGLAKLIVGERPPAAFPVPDGSPSLEPSPVIEASLSSVETLKGDLARARADIERLRSANPIEKLRGVVALKSDVAALKQDAARLRDDTRENPLHTLWGLFGIATGLLHRRFAS